MNGPLGELFRLPDFLRLWLVGATGNAMRWLELLASGLFAWEATQSALAVTVVVAVRQLPQLFFGAFVGAISEAVNRKTIVLLALIVPAVVSTVLATLATTGTLPGDLANAGVTNIKASDIVAAVNAGSTVNIVATGTITQSSALAFAPATGVAGGLTLDTRTGTSASKITLGGITNAGAGSVTIAADASLSARITSFIASRLLIES